MKARRSWPDWEWNAQHLKAARWKCERPSQAKRLGTCERRHGGNRECHRSGRCRRFMNGAKFRRRSVVNWCVCWAKNCGRRKTALGRLVTIEAGKIVSEGLGEVQEMIDICTFAAGLSRQLCGLTIATERPLHRMMETWHPLGVTGVISAFNFPVAVWAWNAALALVCGNSVVWKPSEKTPLTALATQALFERAVAKFGDAPGGLSAVLNGGREIGEALVANRRCRWFPQPARPPWAGRSAQNWPNGLRVRF